MVKSVSAPDDLLATGLEALSDGDWEAARDSFEAALVDREAPEILEGLSWAAWWQDDAETVFTARERAYRLYRQAGDQASAARMAIWLAADHLDFKGAAAVATGWLSRAARLLEPLEPGPEAGWLAFQEGYLAYLAGDSSTAVQLALRAAETGRRFAVPDLEMLGLALEGGALVAGAQVDEGMRRLDEATVTALEGGAMVPISEAWAVCFLVTACLDVRDYRRAFDWSDRIAEFGQRYRSRYMMGFCRSHYGAVHLARGRWTDAEAELLAAADDYARSRPALLGDALVRLAELRRRQGRSQAALELLARAGDSTEAQLCRARLALDQGDALRAIELAERCLRQAHPGRRLGQAPALELLVRARVANGRLEAAAEALAELRTLEGLVRTQPLRASTTFGEGLLAAARAEPDLARRYLEDAADAFERSGAAFEALSARIELAAVLLALGRRQAAKQEAQAALEGLSALGAQIEAARARRMIDACTQEPGHRRPPARVTPRERDVLRLLADGLTNRQIAERLVVSEHTVHRHVTNILRKLDLPSRAAAAAWAVRAGFHGEADA